MYLQEDLASRDRSKNQSKINPKKELLPINLHIIESKKNYDNTNMMKKGLDRSNNQNVVKIFKEEYSMSSMNANATTKNNLASNGYRRSNKNINSLYSNYKIATKTNFHPTGNNNNGNANVPSNASNHHRTLSHNIANNNLYRSISPIKNNLKVEDKSLSPLRDKNNMLRNKLMPSASSQRSLNSNGVANNLVNSAQDAFNTKTKSFNFNGSLKVVGTSIEPNSNTASHSNLVSISNNNFFQNNQEKILPNVSSNIKSIKKKSEESNKLEDFNNKLQEDSHHGINSYRLGNSNVTSNIKKENSNNINSNILNRESINSRERELTPGVSRKFILAKDISERNLFNKKSTKNTRSVSPSINISKDVHENIKNEECNISNTKKASHISKYTTVTKPGINYEGHFKTNQDSYLIKTKIFNLENYSVFGVFDGHGMHGHFVSNLIKLFFADYWARPDLFLGSSKTSNMNMNSTKRSSTKFTSILSPNGLKEDAIYEKIKEKNYNLIKNSFYLAESALSQSKYEVNFSGATSVVVLFVDDKIICANAGDSRAILVVESSESEEGKIISLSKDHKPDLKDESVRIVKSGGRVDRYTENGVKSGPYRVWLKNENFPGLAMSRSVGDFVAESVGVICEPEIFEYDIVGNAPKFIVIASDGVWEFLSNKKIAEIANWYYKNNDVNGAAEKIVEESIKRWKQEDDVVDDVTAVVIFFNKGL